MRNVCGWLALLGLAVALGAAVACGGDKKEPLTPDNPNADPLMLEAGAAVMGGDAGAVE